MREVEALMDEFLADTFPASDPPCWACLAERVTRTQASASRDPDGDAEESPAPDP
jgi:hypothetical protein